MKSKGIFITSTNTDVGKTFMTALVVKKLRDEGYNAGYYKAALSGAEYIDNELTAGDAHYVCKTAGLKNPPNSLVSFIYKTPVSPHLASRIEGNPVRIDKVKSDFEDVKSQFDYVIIEGAGGLICPLRIDDEQKIMQTDVIKSIGTDMLLVTLSGLGTINSTMLTIEYAKQLGISVRGIIMNRFESGNFLHEDNKKQVEFLSGIPVIGCVPENSSDLPISAHTLVELCKEI
jgi:dethiobiotin synthetase